MDAHELARWTRFAAKGGIGKCTATVDCIAQEMGEDLMFLKDDEITVLMQLPEPGCFLGHCEGVVGRFSGSDVRFHGKLKKPVMAKRGSVGPGMSESRTSISLVEGGGSRTEHPGERSRHASESPSNSRPASRAKRTPSPHSKSHAPMQSYSTSYSRSSEDHSPAVSRSTTLIGTHAPAVKDSRASSIKSGHAKPAQMATSISGASIFSVGSASVYSEASTATSVFSAADTASERTRSRNGSLSSIRSGMTERDVPGETEYGNLDQAKGVALVVSMSDTTSSAAPSVPAQASNAMLTALVSSSSSMTASTSLSGTSFASTGLETVHDSFGSVGSISELEAKQFDMSKFGLRAETQTSFVLVPPPLGIGDNRNGLASTVVAPLRVTKSPRLTPSPGLPPSSPLPVPPAITEENHRSTSVSPALTTPLSPAMRGSRPSTSASLGFPGSLPPGLPGSLAAGPRSPGLPGSLSPGFRSPPLSHGPNALSQYTFSSGSGSNSPNPHSPFTNSYGSTPSPTLTSPFTGVHLNRTNASTPPITRTPPASSSPYGSGQPNGAPLSPPPSSPLPPLPSASLPSPQFRKTSLPTPCSPPPMGSAATAAANGRVSPLTVLSSSLPSSTSGTLYPDERHERCDGGERRDERRDEMWDEVEEVDTTRLSTFDEFRQQLDNSGDDEGHSEDDEEQMLRVGRSKNEKGPSAHGNEKEEREEEEDAHSDGEVGIGLSLMGALGGEDDDDEDCEDSMEQAKKTKSENDDESCMGDVGIVADGNGSGAAEKGGTSAMPWTRYTPSSPISPGSSNGHRRNEGEEGGDEDEDEDDGGYWDDIYDDYRYSRYSLASKRFSVASKASGGSKASSKARAHAPPIPVPPDRPSYHGSRPSIGSDGMNGYARPSFESSSSSVSISMPFARPSLARSASDESSHEFTLTAQFPAVPAHVPVRTESRLRIVHDGYMQGSDDHGEREQQVTHGSTEVNAGEVGLNIEVIEAAEEDDGRGQEVVVGVPLTSPNTNAALSPLLHTTFGSPHSSRFTDFEDGSDQDHGRRYSNKSGKSTLSSAEGPPKSPIDGGGMASALRAKMEAERSPSTGTTPSLVVPSLTPNSSLSERPAVRAIVVDDDEGHVTGINITVDDPPLTTEAASPLPLSSPQTPNVAQATVVTDPAQLPPAEDGLDDAEKSPFLRLRPQPSKLPHPFARTSMFLPHPNAPKVVHQSQGPMYGRMAPQPYAHPVTPEAGAGNTTHPTPPGTTFYSAYILHQLRSMSIAMGQGPGRRPPMTLFARCQPDLNASMGPVPILFSLDPFPPTPMPPVGPSTRVNSGRAVPQMANTTPTRAATVSAPVRRGGSEGTPQREGDSGGDTSMLRLPKRSATTFGNMGGPQGSDTSPSPSLPIPREGFVPQVSTTRPRSRSFSEFGANAPVVPQQQRSREEPAVTAQGIPGAVRPSRNASLPPALMARHALSPLVVPSSKKDGSLASPTPIVQSPVTTAQYKVPPSPFTQEPLTHSPLVEATRVATANGLLASPVAISPFVSIPDRDKDVSPVSGPPGMINGTSASSDPRNATSPPSLTPGQQGSFDVPQSSSVEGLPRRSSDSSESRSVASPPPIPDAANARSSPLAQELTVRTKLSLPALRMKASIRSKVDDAVSVLSLPASGENETVQVQDMDFELVKPSLPSVTGRASQESTVTSREADASKPEASPVLGDAASMYSNAPRSPLVPSNATATASTESAESVDAHRQRELKWMALFPTVLPSQARRNKKVRKLLQEGVPSSVRYLVWCHLTDSKARALPGVYTKLVKRPRVPAFAEMEKDAMEGFPDQPQLHTAQGPLVSLLQAYLTMVPDIQYSPGLTLIAGHLLLLAPEEDAFWIFASMMDAYLRTYFSTNTVQIEIDASLFSRALEVIDPALSKKLYVQLSMAPANITQPWFSTLFVGSLSVDHLHRVWDIFLYDGIPFLFRVGLVVINCVRHLLLQADTEEAALAYLVRPPPACLPSPTELLSLAANVKLKDDDVRKQRIKMEQQLKRTTQARPPNGITNMQTATISLPKTS